MVETPRESPGAVTSAAGDREVLLDVRNLDVVYGNGSDAAHAVRDASFVLRRGEMLGIAGESGCGKSTLAFAVAHLLRGAGRVTNGQVLWHGNGNQPLDLVSADEQTLRRVRWAEMSIVMQSAMNALNPVLTLRSQIADVIRAHEPSMDKRRRHARVAELLEMVGIPADRATAYPHELSGGMRQRSTIALALALTPQLVILDEPTTALDVVMQRQVLQELSRLRADLGFAVLFITHDLSLLVEMADRILVMYAGTVVEKADALELYRRPLHPYSYGLLNSFPKLRGERRELEGIPGTPPNPRNLPTGCSFHPRCPRVLDECRTEVPLLAPRTDTELDGTRDVACLLYDAVDTAGTEAAHAH